MRWHRLIIACLIVGIPVFIWKGFLSGAVEKNDPAAPTEERQSPAATEERQSPVPVEERQENQQAKESYYILVFASQAGGNQARLSHTFATFVKATGEHRVPEKDKIESHTISWFPRSLDIVVVRWWPEEGRNLGLRATLEWAESVGARVSMWGPFAIEEELYDRALAQKARLESRSIQYKAVDEKFRPEEASNCIHAVSDIDRDQGLLHVGRNWGEPASQLVVNHLKRWIINPRQTHQWVRDQIGLQDYPLTVRALE